MSTLIKPHLPRGSEPSRDDDPTGVRALLASLPAPDPMPGHLVERINASLAAEQAQRQTRVSGTPATPLLASTRRRPARLLFAAAGAAAAVILVAVVGSNLSTVGQSTETNSGAAPMGASGTAPAGRREASDAVESPAAAAAAPQVTGTGVPGAGAAAAAPGGTGVPAAGAPTASLMAKRLQVTPSLVQIAMSGTRYTQADFVSQAGTLSQAPRAQIDPRAAKSSTVGPAGTTGGLLQCLDAIGVTGAQVVRADVASYQGQPAVIIVATRDGASHAYAVGRQCSPAGAVVLRPATPLP